MKLGCVVVHTVGYKSKQTLIATVQPELHAVLSDSWSLKSVIVLVKLFDVTERKVYGAMPLSIVNILFPQ